MARYITYQLKPLRSYAADSEDLVALAMLGSVGSFLDVGANDGRTCSNTLLFALRGAKGLSLEPDPGNFKRLRAFYRLNRRVRCLEVGLSDSSRFATMRCDGLLSAITGNHDPGLDTLLADSFSSEALLQPVALTTLNELSEDGVIELPVDVLSIDVEGHEYDVLLGNDWKEVPQPARCVIVETHSSGTAERTWRHQNFDAIARLLESHEYVRTCASANNTFWLHVHALEPVRLESTQRQFPHYEWFRSCD
jgi:FkbM family methyltransferase